MPYYRATIIVTLRPAILDVPGKTVEHALHSLGYETVRNVRIGKYITLELEVADSDDAHQQCHAMSQELLANPVIEDFAIATIEPITP
ncbi:MAG: phosphoribosylformylglycinamidine synthase subunit PurS [Chlorobiota bacterium]|jgi:phosphoribosylformylglycinamidine synthase|nr:MAG: phosphoribosylformylglycinamidine synthase subunit PurS [Chlorobiota bacterium]